MSISHTLKLELLEQGHGGLSLRKGAAYAEASFYCLHSQQHMSGIVMKIEGSFDTAVCIEWQYEMSDRILHSWNEKNEATSEGASGIAIMLITSLTEYNAISRAWHKSGVDYFLGYSHTDEPFEAAARLEVSGIRKARNRAEILERVDDKLKQTTPTDATGLPAYVIVVEFSTPQSHVVKK